ncbi:hypothetical protein FA282_20400 [Pseudomonas aeruginosa]|nr:hypothetical protein [Pseudomonas aeruginosa]
MIEIRSLRDLLRLLFIYQREFKLAALSAVVIIVLGAFLLPAKYESNARLLVKPGRDSTLPIEISNRQALVMPSTQRDPIVDEERLLTGRPIVRQVAERYLEVLANRPPPEGLWKRTKFYVKKAIGAVFDGIRVTLETFGVIEETTAVERLAKDLEKKFEVTHAAGSTVMEISFTWSEPEVAQEVVKAWIEIYMEERTQALGRKSLYAFYEAQTADSPRPRASARPDPTFPFVQEPTMLNTLKTLSLAVLLGSGPAQAADAPLKIGTTAAFAPPLEVAVSEAGKQGLKVELVEFSDWNAPNITLAQGDIDANYFQHVPFLENANREGGFQLKPFAPGIINNVGLYSKRYASLAELPEGASVAIANDPINGGRGLQLLQKAGLLKLRDGVGYNATLDDIVDNPKDIRITELEAVQLARALDDFDLAQGYPHYLRLAGTIDPTRALLFDGIDNREYVIQFVTRGDYQDRDGRLAHFVDIYQHSPVVRAALDKAHGTLYQPGWE